jgi:hypothetical protein
LDVKKKTNKQNLEVQARCWWLTAIILATQEAESRRIAIQSQPWQIVQETLSPKYSTQKRGGGVAQGVGPEFKPQYCKKQNKIYIP